MLETTTSVFDIFKSIKNPALQKHATAKIDNAVCILAILSSLIYCFTPEGRKLISGSLKPHSSSIDWCESNYDVHPQIAEFWNVVTNVVMLLAAVMTFFIVFKLGFTTFIKSSPFIPGCMILIALGSMYFHAQLSLLGQIIDELSIIWLNLYGMIFLFGPKHRNPCTSWMSARIHRLVTSNIFIAAVMCVQPIISIKYPIFCHVFTVITLPGVTLASSMIYKSLSKKEEENCGNLYRKSRTIPFYMFYTYIFFK